MPVYLTSTPFPASVPLSLFFSLLAIPLLLLSLFTQTTALIRHVSEQHRQKQP